MTYTKEEIRNIFEKAVSHKCYDKNYNFLGYSAYVDHNWQTLTEEEKRAAQDQFRELKKQKKTEYKKGMFWLCAMWMGKEWDFNNHRARAEFLTPDGKRYFVEFTTYKRKDMDHEELHLDYLINRTMEGEYSLKLEKLREKNKEKPNRCNRSEEDQKEWKKYFKQDYYWDRYHEGAAFLKWKQATRETALQMINTLFKTDFKELEIVEYLIEPDFLNK